MPTFALTLLTLCVATLVGRLPLAAQGRSNILTVEEIDQANVGTAYDAVQALRPRWLQSPRELGRQPQKGLDTRGPGIAVYIGNVSVGDIEYLRTIPAATVLELRWLSPFDAASRFSATDGQSAILVTLKRGG